MSQLHPKRSTHIGSVLNWQEEKNGISGQTDRALFRVIAYTDSIIRVTNTKENSFESFSYSVIVDPTPTEIRIEESTDDIRLQTAKLIAIINKNKFGLSFQTLDGRVINEDDPLGTCWSGDQATVYKKLQDGERFIGLGEKTGHLDRRGQGYEHWNTDNFAYQTNSDPLYCSTPFYIGIHNALKYGVYLDNTFKSFFNFGASNDRFSSVSVDAGELDYYFIAGDTIPKILEGYSLLTGRIPLPPKWSIGYQQCRYSYFPDKEVISVAKTFRDKEIPADVIVLDIHYMDAYKIFTWQPDHFANPQKLITDLKSLGFEVVVMCDPGIKVEKGYHAYDSGIEEDIFIKYPDGSNYTGQVWPGWCHFPDFTNPKTRDWWKQKLKDYTKLGIKGFWNDMNEIATWGNQLPENIEMDFEGNKDSIRRGRNIYGFQMARATFEGVSSSLDGQRPFNLTRSAFSGIQRYAAVWTGDNVATDEHMMLGTRMLNSLGLTGIPFCGYDAGGFVKDASPKLFGRWISLAAFSPFFRGHSMVNSRDAEPWSFGEEVEEISRNYIKLRYRLMPYLYSAFYEASQNGLPINRSLAIYHPDNEFVYKKEYENQYYFGPSILVAPVESYKELTKVYLPEGRWYGLFDDHVFMSGEVLIECPIEKLPLFVRESSILVMDELVGDSTKFQSDILEIHIYHGKAGCSYSLYYDDGETLDYQKGNFSIQEINFDPTVKQITIGECTGSYPCPYKAFKIFLHGFESIRDVAVDKKASQPDRAEYRFASPLRSFDPIISVNEGYRIKNLQVIELSASKKPIQIEWK